MPAKEFWRSRIFWFNVLTLALVVAGHFGYYNVDPDPVVYEIGGVIAFLINIALRFRTDQGIRLRR